MTSPKHSKTHTAKRLRAKVKTPAPKPAGRPKPKRNDSSQTDPQPQSLIHGVRPNSKLGTVLTMLSSQDGATIEALCKATGWQSHSVRGVLAGAIKKRLGLTVLSERVDGTRIYKLGHA